MIFPFGLNIGIFQGLVADQYPPLGSFALYFNYLRSTNLSIKAGCLNPDSLSVLRTPPF